MKSFFKTKKIRKLLLILLVVVCVLATFYFLIHGSNYFSHTGIRQIRNYTKSFGIFAPFIVVFLIFLSTAIPPLPLPVPLVELAAGAVFGFAESALIIWISQIGSSIFAFYIARFLKKRFFGANIIKNSRWDFYRSYLNKKGALAVFLIRFVMAAPFNIISYLAGLTQINIVSFIIATTLGTIPESLLYSYLGSQIRTLHIKLAYLSLLIIFIGSLGFIFTLILMFLLKPQQSQKKN
jgi:uncharacterized membrane protein YdjX (TVP38/TMEM64 family)